MEFSTEIIYHTSFFTNLKNKLSTLSVHTLNNLFLTANYKEACFYQKKIRSIELRTLYLLKGKYTRMALWIDTGYLCRYRFAFISKELY